jgi:hypothetical protein
MVAKIEKKKLVASTENIEEPTVDALIWSNMWFLFIELRGFNRRHP